MGEAPYIMKNLFLGLLMLIGAASFANTEDPIKKLPIAPAPVELVQKSDKIVIKQKVADDAIYCSIKVNGNEASCWLCDCNELAKTLK
ncbi:hypothetical protein RCH18_003059 [Flavobacterium sp. PL11]|nr:hypothetical protein [Flavobacterium sp. PL11]